MAIELLQSRGMIRRSEKRRLVGAEAPVTRAAIQDGFRRLGVAYLRSQPKICQFCRENHVAPFRSGICDTDVEPFCKVVTSKRLPGMVGFNSGLTLVVMKEK